MNAPHNVGGKIRLRLADGVAGDAMFAGPNDCYRLILTRKWINLFNPHTRLPRNFIMWICMNPSVASATDNDPTVARIEDFSMRWDFDGLVLVNVCDFRATKPDALLAPGMVPCSKGNLPLIRNTAKEAQRIVCAWGNLHRDLVHYAVDVESALRADGHTLYALGTNAGGSPKHPLYVKGDTKLIEFKGVPA